MQLLIMDGEVTDDVVYERVYQFFNQTEDKEEAQENVEGACRQFIADQFGDNIVEVRLRKKLDQKIDFEVLFRITYMHEIIDERNDL